MISTGYNPLGNIQVVSALNTANIGTHMYHYNYEYCTTKYYPKLYLGTPETVGIRWIYDIQNGVETTLPNWPQNFGQGTQKGEAN